MSLEGAERRFEQFEEKIKHRVTTGDGWPKRSPIPNAVAVAPSLPDHLVPARLRPWLCDAAERMCAPLEFLAAPAIVALGAVVGRSLGIHPKRQDDWLVVPNLWGGVVGASGILKTPALDEATRFSRKMAAAASEAHKAGAEAIAIRHESLDLQIRGLKRSAKPDQADAVARDITRLTREKNETRAIQKRYLTSDATVEKLGELLADNPRGLLVLRDELTGWIQSLDRQGQECARAFYLEAWNGTGDFYVDRIGRGSSYIPALTISILGGIQPGPLRRLVGDAVRGGSQADGLLQRVQVLVWPDELPDFVNVDRWPDSAGRQLACSIFEMLDNIDAAKVGAGMPTDGGVPALRFTSEAQELFDAWREELEVACRRDADESPAYTSHRAKYRSLVPALALLFHLVEAVGERDAGGSVSLDAARNAAAWVDFLDGHARKVYADEIAPGVAPTNALARKIETGAVRDGMPVREIERKNWSRLDRTQLPDALNALENANWILVEEIPPRPAGGRPSRVVRLHPDLLGTGLDREDSAW